MCECGCSSINGDVAFTPRGFDGVVAIDIYPGCRECAQLVGIDIRVFDKPGASEWLYGRQAEVVDGNEYGHLPTWKSIEIFSMEDLADAFSEQYGDLLADLSPEDLLHVVQSAMRKCRARSKKEVSK